MLETVAVMAILVALILSTIALIRSLQPKVAVSGASATSSNAGACQYLHRAGIQGRARRQEARCVHRTNFAVKAGQTLEIKVDNTDEQPHSITAPEANVNITAMPGVHTYTVVIQKAGNYQWYCVYPCDSGANGWAMKHAGYMSGFITVS